MSDYRRYSPLAELIKRLLADKKRRRK